jgi:hypothetical protein
VVPGPLSGDRRSSRIEAHAALLLAVVEQQSDATLAEIRTGLAKGRDRDDQAVLPPVPDHARRKTPCAAEQDARTS